MNRVLSPSRILLVLAALAVLIPVIAGGFPAGADDAQKKVQVLVGEGDEDDVIINLKEGPVAWALTKGGKRGFLGVQLVELTPELRTWLGATEKAGVLVGHVQKDSPAAKAGIKVGDLIIAIGKEDMESSWDIRQAVRDRKEGEVVMVDLFRDRRMQSIPVSIAIQEAAEMDFREFLVSPHGETGKVFKFDTEHFEDLAKRIQEELNRPEIKDKLLKVQERRVELEKRLQELEERLQEMEEKLKKKQEED